MTELKPCPYMEILALYEYCKKIGINAILESFFDGYVIRFPNGSDFIQHGWSYGSKNGCVEPAIGSKLDYTAVPLDNAKRLVYRHKEKLNCSAKMDGDENG